MKEKLCQKRLFRNLLCCVWHFDILQVLFRVSRSRLIMGLSESKKPKNQVLSEGTSPFLGFSIWTPAGGRISQIWPQGENLTPSGSKSSDAFSTSVYTTILPCRLEFCSSLTHVSYTILNKHVKNSNLHSPQRRCQHSFWFCSIDSSTMLAAICCHWCSSYHSYTRHVDPVEVRHCSGLWCVGSGLHLGAATGYQAVAGCKRRVCGNGHGSTKWSTINLIRMTVHIVDCSWTTGWGRWSIATSLIV